MRPFTIFFGYLLGCLLLGALLSYPLYLGLEPFLEVAPHRLMGRVAQLLVLLGFWWFLRAQGLNHRVDLGFAPAFPELRRKLLHGWIAGVAILAVLALGLVLLGIRQPLPASPRLWTGLARALPNALLAGLLIGLVEETFFRGALYAAIRRHGSAGAAMVLSSLLYAALHFLKPHPLPPGMPFDWSASAWLFLGTFQRFADPAHLDAFVALFVAGVFLAAVRERTGHIAYNIGLHAGWVLTIKLTREVTDLNATSPLRFLVADYDGMIGWLAAFWMALLTLLLLLHGRQRGPTGS